MALNYYDDVIIAKIKRWLPEQSKIRILKPDETTRLFELTADDLNDNPFTLPLIAISRDTSIELQSTVKSSKTFDGLKLLDINGDLRDYKGEDFTNALNNIPDKMPQLNVIPVSLNYQLDIYTKTYEEGDEYMRSFLFKLINNPVIKIEIPYNGVNIEHIANIKVGSTVADNSSISERIFPGQFTRWTISFEVLDAFLFNIPYRKTWKLYVDEDTVENSLEIANNLYESGEIEEIESNWKKK